MSILSVNNLFFEEINIYINNLVVSKNFYSISEPQFLEDKLKTYIYRLAYYNFINWHCENISKSINENISIWGYAGTVKFNKLRNFYISEIDAIIYGHNSNIKDDSLCLPTTFGLVIDSYVILQIKKSYCNNKEKCTILEEQAKTLANAIVKTLQKFLNHEIKFLRLDKEKFFI